MFQGIRSFHTHDPAQLSTELMRQNANIEGAFAEVEAEKVTRWNVIRSTESSIKASHGDMVVAGFNGEAVVLLPPASRQKPGRAVLVVQAANFGLVTVAAQPGELVNGFESVTMGGNVGWRVFYDDGRGWWGPAT